MKQCPQCGYSGGGEVEPEAEFEDTDDEALEERAEDAEEDPEVEDSKEKKRSFAEALRMRRRRGY